METQIDIPSTDITVEVHEHHVLDPKCQECGNKPRHNHRLDVSAVRDCAACEFKEASLSSNNPITHAPSKGDYDHETA